MVQLNKDVQNDDVHKKGNRVMHSRYLHFCRFINFSLSSLHISLSYILSPSLSLFHYILLTLYFFRILSFIYAAYTLFRSKILIL